MIVSCTNRLVKKNLNETELDKNSIFLLIKITTIVKSNINQGIISLKILMTSLNYPYISS